MSEVLDLGEGVQIGGRYYKLARREVVEKAGLPSTTRVWEEMRRKIATKVEPRQDTQPGDIPGEWIIVWRNCGQGITGDMDNLEGAVHYTRNADHYTTGRWAGMPALSTLQTDTNAWGADPVRIVTFRNRAFLVAGRYLIDVTTTATTKDFGAGIFATDAIVFNNELVVGFGGSTNELQKSDSAGTWTTSTEGVYADYFAIVLDKLWRATATNEVSNVDSTDNPFTLANWTSGITVGDDDVPITRLAEYGERLAVAKETGLHLGDKGAIFPNLLPMPQSSHNGTRLHGMGANLFYNQTKHLWAYATGGAEEVGPEQVFTSVARGGDSPPGVNVTAITTSGKDIFIATEPSALPQADPTGFQYTTNNGGAYTDETADVGDNTGSSDADISNLSTVADGDWFIVGYSAAFYGFSLTMSAYNLNTSAMTVEFWNGSAWTAFPGDRPAIDRTSANSITLNESNWVAWRALPVGWAASTINSINAFWVRVSFSAALSANVKVAECRIITTAMESTIMRGRLRHTGDRRFTPIIWSTICSTTTLGPVITALGVERQDHRGLVLVAASRQAWLRITLPENIEDTINEGALGYVYLARHDGGMPEMNKAFLGFTIKGKTIDANHVVGLHYNLNDQAATWTAVSASITATPTTTALTSITGYSIQPRMTINAFNNDTPTEINELECRFRELPTYKSEFGMLLEVGNGQSTTEGGNLPDVDVQMTNLRSVQGTQASLVGPLGDASVTAVYRDMQVQELVQLADEPPVLLVNVKATEV